MEHKNYLELEPVLRYLHECLLHGSISMFSDYFDKESLDYKIMDGKTIKDLHEIRDNLLSQVNFSKKS